MIIRQNQSLKKMNTFGIDVYSKIFAEIRKVNEFDQLKEYKEFTESPWEILGGGSNILYTQDRENPVIKVSIPGVKVFTGPGNDVLVKAGSGVGWHDLVVWSLENKIYGLENLSLIPGQVGAAPIQNIGAYGVEIKDVFETLEAYAINSGNIVTMDAYDCGFGYRSSVFKGYEKGKYIITSLTLRLSRTPQIQVDYGDIRATLAEMGIKNPTPVDVSKAVINIRRNKLPDPATVGNAGSFFKNPEIQLDRYQKLLTDFPSMPGYPTPSGSAIKVPAGWLIDQLGWKGFRKNDAGVHQNQALVLVNHGNAKGQEIVELSEQITKSVFDKYGIQLQQEVNIL